MFTSRKKGLSFKQQCLMMRSSILSTDKTQDFNSVRDILELYEFPLNYPLTESGETALMIAAGQCKLSIMNILLKHGADPNVVDEAGNSAVIYCLKSLKSSALEAMRMLHENGAVLCYMNYEGKRPLDYIESYKSKNMDEYEDILENYTEFTSKYCVKVCLYYAFQLKKTTLI